MPFPKLLRDAIDKYNFLEIIAGCSFDNARVLYEYRAIVPIHWPKILVQLLYYIFARERKILD